MVGIRAGSRGEPSRSARPGSSRQLPGEAVTQGVHTEAGRAAKAARDRHVGGQDPSAGGGRGIDRDRRGGLPRLLLRVSAWAFTASSVGRARGRDPEEEGELDSGRWTFAATSSTSIGRGSPASWSTGSGIEALRLIQKWMSAGVIENGELGDTLRGTPQGGKCAAAHKAPCGVPSSVSTNSPFSITPALIHFWIRRRSLRSPIRCSRNRAIHDRSMCSK